MHQYRNTTLRPTSSAAFLAQLLRGQELLFPVRSGQKQAPRWGYSEAVEGEQQQIQS